MPRSAPWALSLAVALVGAGAMNLQLRELGARLSAIERVFDLGELSGRGLHESEIRSYYRASALAYRLVHCSEGAMHLALNPDGEFDRDGYLGPVREVERRIPGDASAILELAVGNGFNTAYLAPRHPQIDFSGVDLTPAHIRAARRRTAHLENVGVHLENFQRLSYEDASFDVVFVVESLCHATDMPRALCEAHRVLRPDGRLIVIDGWRGESFRALPQLARRAAALTEQAMSVGAPWALGDWLDEARAHRFELSEEIDISPWIMPNLLRLERFAASYFHHPVLARLCARLAPTRLLANAIAGYLMPLTVAVGAHTYRLVSMRRA